MKNLLKFAFIALFTAALATACNSDDEDNPDDIWSRYERQRVVNEEFYNQQKELKDADGKPFYQTVVPSWNASAEILIHYFNDRAETAENLVPMWNSTCAVKYLGRLYNDVAFDSSYNEVNQLRNFQPSEVITGWAIALMDMHVGDSARIVVPYPMGYGSSITNASIPPYSTLVFDMKLQDITAYEFLP